MEKFFEKFYKNKIKKLLKQDEIYFWNPLTNKKIKTKRLRIAKKLLKKWYIPIFLHGIKDIPNYKITEDLENDWSAPTAEEIIENLKIIANC